MPEKPFPNAKVQSITKTTGGFLQITTELINVPSKSMQKI